MNIIQHSALDNLAAQEVICPGHRDAAGTTSAETRRSDR